MLRESKTLEYRESLTNASLKTVSAYANYGSGDIDNRINDSMDPVPKYTLAANELTSVVALHVSDGPYKPCLYRGKAYRRSDSSTVEVDRQEL